jgi:DNA-directed RNA polymerase specialized sigma24 family protein
VSARDRLAGIVSAELLDLVDAYVDERVAAAVAESTPATTNLAHEWLTLEQAGQRLSCSVDAVRMRAKRGRLEKRHVGRRVYVSRASVEGVT